MEAKQAADTEPTYPKPKMLTDELTVSPLLTITYKQQCKLLFPDPVRAAKMDRDFLPRHTSS
jgi:hypothetical protein